MLDVVPAQYRVKVIRRPRYGWSALLALPNRSGQSRTALHAELACHCQVGGMASPVTPAYSRPGSDGVALQAGTPFLKGSERG